MILITLGYCNSRQLLYNCLVSAISKYLPCLPILRTQTYFRLSLVFAEDKVTAGNTVRLRSQANAYRKDVRGLFRTNVQLTQFQLRCSLCSISHRIVSVVSIQVAELILL